MKTNRTRALLLGSISALALALAGCGSAQSYRAQGTDISPAASGDIRVGKTAGAQMVEVDLEHLAPPDRLARGMTRYAVWVVPSGQNPVLAGFLEYDENDQSGKLRATTPYEAFDVLVTAETDTLAPYPSDVVVIRRSVP